MSTNADKIAKAVKNIEGQFPRPAPLIRDPFDREAAKADPRNDLLLANLKHLFHEIDGCAKQQGIAIVEMEAALYKAKTAHRQADRIRESVRAGVRDRLETLGLEVPREFHGFDCGCEKCEPTEHGG